MKTWTFTLTAFATVLGVVWLSCLADEINQTDSPKLDKSPLVLFRKALTLGDPDRDWTYCWTRGGNLGKTWRFGGETVAPFSIPSTVEFWDREFHGGIKATRPGQFEVDCGRGAEAVLTVAPPINRKSKRIHASADSAYQIQRAVDAGYREFILEAGEHVLDKTVILPDDSMIRGYGAVVRRTAANPPAGEKSNLPAFIPGSNVSIYGLTFQHDRSDLIFLSRKSPSGLVCADCTFRRCQFGFFMKDVLIRDCRFESAGAVIVPGGLWLRCTFSGMPPQHTWAYWSNQGPVALIDCVFDGTDRGPIFNAAGGPISDVLCCGLICKNINATPNGNEIFLCEGEGPFDRPMVFHTRVTSCQSAVFQFDRVSRNGICRDLFIDGGMGLCLWGRNISGWEVSNFELRNGAGIYLGAGAKYNRFIDGSIIAWAPGRANQTYQNPSPLGYKRKIAAWAEGSGAATNVLQRVEFLGIDRAFTNLSGFTVSN